MSVIRSSSVPLPLVGRDAELHRLRAMISAARNGASSSIVLRGDPGIGKSSILEEATTGAVGARILRVDGFESESAMAYAALQRLTAPLREHLHRLPDRQRGALLVATGADSGAPPERFLVGLGVLSMLAAAAETGPLICIIDDAHHLDAESLDVLAFVARRLSAEATLLLFAARDDPLIDGALGGVAELRITGLPPLAAIELLRSRLDDEIDPILAARIVEQTGGNPLVLHDLAAELTTSSLTAVSLTPDPTPVGHQLEAHYLAQAASLTDDTRMWMLVAAADTTGDPAVIDAVALVLGVPEGSSSEAERSGLVDVRETVAFRHPLTRSAVYNDMSSIDRRRAHIALCAHTEDQGRPVVAAWHAAAATVGVDEVVAARLEHAAEDAAARGGLATRARLLARAAELSPSASSRDDRLISAAEAAVAVGAARFALSLLDRVESTSLSASRRGRVLAARATLPSFTGDREGVVWAPALMLRAAESFEEVDVENERWSLLHAFEFSMVTEQRMASITLDDIGRRFQERAGDSPGLVPDTLRAISALILSPYPDAVPLLQRAREQIESLDDSQVMQFGIVCVTPTIGLWDAAACVRFLRRIARIARDTGALRALDAALWVLSVVEITRGDPAASARYVEQVRELRRALGYESEQVVNAAYLAWSGAPREYVLAAAEGALAAGIGGGWTLAMVGLAVRDIAEGDYRNAYEILRELTPLEFAQARFPQFAELVEAGVRSGHVAEVLPTVQLLDEHASAVGTDWVRGVAARSRALVSDHDEAETQYLAAIHYLETAEMPGELARAHLLYGEWLRRRKRRREARVELHIAWNAFELVEARPFAERARREFEATGERLPAGASSKPDALTAQEASVARLAAGGATNSEIGAALFISANTVDYHLRKVFRKVGVTSRKQLAQRLDASVVGP